MNTNKDLNQQTAFYMLDILHSVVYISLSTKTNNKLSMDNNIKPTLRSVFLHKLY